ncbi:HepT-like ribonuclease domain-containing protein [Dermatophilaceae bacterium Soc4.6]
MRDAAVAARDIVGTRAVEEVASDALRRSALLWHVTVLGEAASQVSTATRESHPDIAWRAATRLRNRIVHGYWDIDIATLVATSVDDLPGMISLLEAAIMAMQESDQDPQVPRNSPGD